MTQTEEAPIVANRLGELTMMADPPAKVWKALGLWSLAGGVHGSIPFPARVTTVRGQSAIGSTLALRTGRI
jgi:hypothetical protein